MTVVVIEASNKSSDGFVNFSSLSLKHYLAFAIKIIVH